MKRTRWAASHNRAAQRRTWLALFAGPTLSGLVGGWGLQWSIVIHLDEWRHPIRQVSGSPWRGPTHSVSLLFFLRRLASANSRTAISYFKYSVAAAKSSGSQSGSLRVCFLLQNWYIFLWSLYCLPAPACLVLRARFARFDRAVCVASMQID